MRLAEINRLIEFRHGGKIPENDDPTGGYIFVAACTVYAELKDPADRMSFFLPWLSRAASWIPDPRLFIDDLMAQMHPRGKHLTDAAAGKCVRLLLAERRELGLRTMSPCDLTPLQFSKLRKEAKRAADRERAERKRRATGAKPQALSATKTKTWLAEGFNSRKVGRGTKPK